MRNSNAMLLDDDDEQQGQDESPAKPAVRPSGTAGRRQLVEDSSDEEVEEVEDAQPPTATSAGAGGSSCRTDAVLAAVSPRCLHHWMQSAASSNQLMLIKTTVRSSVRCRLKLWTDGRFTQAASS